MSKGQTKRMREWYGDLVCLKDYYRTLGISRYEWNGLPEEIPIFMPETYLYDQGQCAMIQLPGSDKYGIFPVAWGSAKLDFYGYPVEWRCYVVGSSPGADIIRNKVFTKEDSVLIWNNSTRTGLGVYVESMCKRMLDIDNTIKTNVLIQNTPLLFKGTQENMLTAKNLMANYQIEPAVFMTEMSAKELQFEAINPGVSFIGADLNDLYEEFHGRILRYLGIDHVSVEKKERLITGEANVNDDINNLVMEARLKLRQQSCDRMKEVFGLDVSVDINKPDEYEEMEEMNDYTSAYSAPQDTQNKN